MAAAKEQEARPHRMRERIGRLREAIAHGTYPAPHMIDIAVDRLWSAVVSGGPFAESEASGRRLVLQRKS